MVDSITTWEWFKDGEIVARCVHELGGEEEKENDVHYLDTGTHVAQQQGGE